MTEISQPLDALEAEEKMFLKRIFIKFLETKCREIFQLII